MEEYEKIVGKLKAHEFAAKLSDGKIVEYDGDVIEHILEKLENQDDCYMDSVVVVRGLGRALALLLVQSEIAEVCAEKITEEAIDILETYGIEYEYMEEVQVIPESMESDEKVSEVDDPMEAIDILR